MYFIIPILDYVIGTDRSNPPESVVSQLEADNYYKHIVYADTPLQYAGTLTTVWFAATELGALGIIAGLFRCAYVNGIGINTGHELGLHRRVATPEDPASSKMDESFWCFLPRTVIGSLHPTLMRASPCLSCCTSHTGFAFTRSY